MTDRMLADCCYGSEHQHADWQPCPQTEQAAMAAEHYGRCFGEEPPNGERGTNIVWTTAQGIAAAIRRNTRPPGAKP
jgi:hypothetical protein